MGEIISSGVFGLISFCLLKQGIKYYRMGMGLVNPTITDATVRVDREAFGAASIFLFVGAALTGLASTTLFTFGIIKILG